MNQTIYTCTLCLPQPLCQKFKQSARNSRLAVKQSKRIVTRLDLFIFIFLSMLPQLARKSCHAVKQSGHIVTRSDLFILIFLSMLPFSCYVYPRFDLYNCDILHIPHHIQVTQTSSARSRISKSRRSGEDLSTSRSKLASVRAVEVEEIEAAEKESSSRLHLDFISTSGLGRKWTLRPNS